MLTGESRIKWWREARFGMFIHWGIYAIPGRGEWVQWNEQIAVKEYAKLADQFKPSNFNPDAWAELAKSAGIKYIVPLAARREMDTIVALQLDSPANAIQPVQWSR